MFLAKPYRYCLLRMKQAVGAIKHKLRRRLPGLALGIIDGCGKRIMFLGKNPWLFKVPGYYRLLRFTADFFKLIYHMPGIPAWEISDAHIKTIFMGSRKELDYFRHLLFEADGDKIRYPVVLYRSSRIASIVWN